MAYDGAEPVDSDETQASGPSLHEHAQVALVAVMVRRAPRSTATSRASSQKQSTPAERGGGVEWQGRRNIAESHTRTWWSGSTACAKPTSSGSTWRTWSEHTTPQAAGKELDRQIACPCSTGVGTGRELHRRRHWRVVTVTRDEAYRRRAW